MRKHYMAATLVLLLCAGQASASGYRISAQSIDSTATAGAHVANTPGADAAYYNPANMAWLDDEWHFEGDVNMINLWSVSYTDNRNQKYDSDSESELFFLPTMFLVSPSFGPKEEFRFGAALTSPAGLRKRWNDPYAKTFAEEFDLRVVEGNGSFSYQIKPWVSAAAGLRVLYSDANVRTNGNIDRLHGVLAGSQMNGRSWDMGYNLALSAKPMEKLQMGMSYRTTVDIEPDGDAHLWTSADFAGATTYTGKSSVIAPVPGVLALGAAYTFDDSSLVKKPTFELAYDRTDWSSFETLDFEFGAPLDNPYLTAAFDSPKDKDWENSNAYRLGLRGKLGEEEKWTLMGGIAFDETPIPDESLSFDVPDSDAMLYSLGLRYQLNKEMELGAAALYDAKQSRDVTNHTLNGTIDDGGGMVLTMGYAAKF